jgi:hypothetical protein
VASGVDEDWLHFIVGPVVGQRPLLRAFRIEAGQVEEASVVVQA